MTGPFDLFDLIALAGFLLMWTGYTVAADYRPVLGRSTSELMFRHRIRWLRSMCDRENRIGDTSLMANLMRSVSFFASATVLILGAIVALVASGERGYAAFAQLPFAVPGTHGQFEIKVLLLGVVFIYAFFQITWSLRQFNYCCVLIGAAPPVSAEGTLKDAYANQAARLQGLAAASFNRGLRAYYFALAGMAWFAGPLPFLAATAFVVAIQYRREFRSKTLATLQATLDI